MQGMQVQFLGQEDPQEEEMATHSSILGFKIPWTEEPGGLQSMKVVKSWTQLSTHTRAHTHTHTHAHICNPSLKADHSDSRELVLEMEKSGSG